MTIDEIKKAAHDTFVVLKSLFQDPSCNVNWRLGHSFDTIVDYLVTNPADADGFGKIAIAKYADVKNHWYDDFGWWSIATLNASQHKDLFGAVVCGQFQKIAVSCWTSLGAATGVWDKWKANELFAPLEPNFPGGVWNSDWDSTAGAGCNPLNPKDELCGYQNTVTNGLYLVSASRLHRFFNDGKYRAAAEREYAFLLRWFINTRSSLLNYYDLNDKSRAVVRERVPRYKSSAKVYGYRPTFAWAGDQGLILGGLVDRMLNEPDPNDQMLGFAENILAGTKEYLTVDGILLPWWPDPAPDGDRYDYRTGTGVFMRYLSYAYQSKLKKPDLKTYLTKNYWDFVRENVEYVLQYPSPKTGTDPNALLITLTNDLATLVAGIVMLPDID
jgi:hypothetical protein